MIGKIFRPFSNDWKKFSRPGSGRDSSHKGHKRGGKRDNLDNIGQLLQGAPPQPGGGRKANGEAGNHWERGRPAREAQGKQKPSEIPNIFHNPAPRPGRCDFQSRQSGWRAGGMREEGIYKNISNPASRTRTAWRGLEPALKTMKTASRTMESGRGADGMSERGRPAREGGPGKGRKIALRRVSV